MVDDGFLHLELERLGSSDEVVVAETRSVVVVITCSVVHGGSL